jgi:hypothetical protein
MSTIVMGYRRGGVAYRAAVGPSAADHPAAVGCLHGPPDLLRLVQARGHRPVQLSPTGPTVEPDLDDPVHMLAVLRELTRVVDVQGDDVPADDPAPAGTVY